MLAPELPLVVPPLLAAPVVVPAAPTEPAVVPAPFTEPVRAVFATHKPTEQVWLAAHWAELSQTVAPLLTQVPFALQNSPEPQSTSVRQLDPEPPDEQADSRSEPNVTHEKRDI